MEDFAMEQVPLPALAAAGEPVRASPCPDLAAGEPLSAGFLQQQLHDSWCRP